MVETERTTQIQARLMDETLRRLRTLGRFNNRARLALWDHTKATRQ